jgi:hypothetical protein
MPALDDRHLVEAAATGISGAAHFGDAPYARQRHDELIGAARRLAPLGLDLVVLTRHADGLLSACLRRDVEKARRYALDIIRLLSFLQV